MSCDGVDLQDESRSLTLRILGMSGLGCQVATCLEALFGPFRGVTFGGSGISIGGGDGVIGINNISWQANWGESTYRILWKKNRLFQRRFSLDLPPIISNSD